MSKPEAQSPTVDQEIVAWIERQQRQLPFTELALACLQCFGHDRAWSVEQIREYWLAAHPVILRSPIDRDAELLAFLRDRFRRLTGPDMLVACRAHFPASRVPSRSALNRWLNREQSVYRSPKSNLKSSP
jgi:hypothetical protein